MVYVIFLTHSSRIPLHHTHATSRFWFQQQCSVSSWFQKFVFILNDYKYRLNSEIQSFDISYILSQVTIIIQIFESSLFVKGLNSSFRIENTSPGNPTSSDHSGQVPGRDSRTRSQQMTYISWSRCNKSKRKIKYYR